MRSSENAILARVEPKAAGRDITKGGSDYLPAAGANGAGTSPQHLPIVDVVPQEGSS